MDSIKIVYTIFINNCPKSTCWYDSKIYSVLIKMVGQVFNECGMIFIIKVYWSSYDLFEKEVAKMGN